MGDRYVLGFQTSPLTFSESKVKETFKTRTNSIDYLKLSSSAAARRIISRNGAVDEHIEFSDFVIKINPRDKPQERILIITNKALYNVLPTDYSRCKRRIPLELIKTITISKVSDEFVIHVPSEYDYRILSLRKEEIVDCIRRNYAFCSPISQTLNLIHSPQIVLKDCCITKRHAKKYRKELERCYTSSTGSTIANNSSEEESKRAHHAICPMESITSPSKVTGWSREETEAGPDDFQLLRVIGRGSFGKVMLVKKKGKYSSDKVYAMKILKKESIIKRGQVQHTKDERKILELINHPFLVKLHYAFQTKSKLYLVMDYLTGGELFFHLNVQKRFSESRSKLYIAEIALGLGHLHDNKIIYRDLKPENILLDETGHVRLTDFGLSKRYTDGKLAKTFCGTPEYLAPEIVSGEGHSKEVDWWSLGILLYEMLVGIPPFYAKEVNLMYEYILRAPFRVPSFISNKAKALIHALLQKDPSSRLGYGKLDVESIKEASFFDELDWHAVYNKEYIPEFTPRISHNADTSNFDPEFTSEPIVDSVVPPSALGNLNINFKGFTYKDESTLEST